MKEKLDKENKQQLFKKTLSELSERFKDSPIAPVTEQPKVEVKTISSGSLILDSVIGGGFPVGRIIEIYGENASGKTSIALTAIANVQREGGTAVFLDVEQAFDPNYARNLGVNLDTMGFAQPTFAEDTLNMVKQLCMSGNVDLIVVDSIASMVPKVESEQDLEKSSVGVLARLLSKALKQIVSVANQNNCTVIFLNQMREKVGVMFGDNRDTAGGRATKYYASQRIEVARKGKVEEDGEIIGNEIRFKCVKNKIAPPYAEGLTVLTYFQGINRPAEIIVLGEQLGVLEKSGRTTYFKPKKTQKYTPTEKSGATVEPDGKIKIGTSAKATLKEIEENKELYNLIAESVLEKLNKKQGISKPEE